MVTTRKRARAGEVDIGSPAPADVSTPKKSDLPAKPARRGMRDVSAPLSNTSASSTIYVLAFIAATFFAFYAYRTVSTTLGIIKQTTPSVHGSSWGLGFGKKHRGKDSTAGGRHEKGITVESRIEELANALGVPSPDLARAIAGAVREYVPPASLSSISKQAEKTGGSQVVDRLLGKEEKDSSVIGSVGETLGSVVGLDDGPEGM